MTLSGTHGSGKSTNAGRVYYLLNESGRKFSYLRHQDLIDPFGFVLRRAARALHVDVGYLEATAPLTLLWSLYFLFIYYPLLAGGIALRRNLGYSVVVDRYVYDLIVGFWGNQRRVPIEHTLVWILPHPDLSFVMEADEKRILVDRPEHTIEFIRNEKRLYDLLAVQFHLKKISTAESVQQVWRRLETEIECCMDATSEGSTAGKT